MPKMTNVKKIVLIFLVLILYALIPQDSKDIIAAVYVIAASVFMISLLGFFLWLVFWWLFPAPDDVALIAAFMVAAACYAGYRIEIGPAPEVILQLVGMAIFGWAICFIAALLREAFTAMSFWWSRRQGFFNKGKDSK